jgi:hypothetical protein
VQVIWDGVTNRRDLVIARDRKNKPTAEAGRKVKFSRRFTQKNADEQEQLGKNQNRGFNRKGRKGREG